MGTKAELGIFVNKSNRDGFAIHVLRAKRIATRARIEVSKMFRSKTLFIVGAGASNEAGLPTGYELRTQIARNLDIRYEHGFRLLAGNPEIADALQRHAHVNSQDVNSYLHAGRMIRDAMAQALSIDNYLDAHQTDARIQLCGKLAIVDSILSAERKSSLFFNYPERSTINQNAIQTTWYSSFFQLLTENVRKDEIDSLFRNVSFLTFNYDRCIEHFLLHALQNYYVLHDDEALNCARSVAVSHPFGIVGHLYPDNQRARVGFGAAERRNLLELSSQIKTFTERIEDEASLSTIRQAVSSAETIVFLGFAFHETNMELLRSPSPCAAKRVFATARGISPSDCAVVTDDILRMLGMKQQHVAIAVRNDLTCHGYSENTGEFSPDNIALILAILWARTSLGELESARTP